MNKRETEAKLLGETHEYQREVHHGNMGDIGSDDGAGGDYELSMDKEDGKLVESVDGRACCGETSGMQLS